MVRCSSGTEDTDGGTSLKSRVYQALIQPASFQILGKLTILALGAYFASLTVAFLQ